jgi:acyl-CoA thioesterase
MGNLGDETAVEPLGNGRYRATLWPDWAIWGPNGGYLAATALRAAGRHTSLPRPASLYCHYLAPPNFGEVELEVVTLRAGRRAESLRVVMEQRGRAVLEATVWAVADQPGPNHQWVPMPQIAPPLELASVAEVAEERGKPSWEFWKNVEIRAAQPDRSPDGAAGEPVLVAWQRFRPQATFDDPWIDACRSAILIDIGQFPAISFGFPQEEMTFIAPSLDVYVAFHQLAPDAEWLCGETKGTSAYAGVIGGTATLWAPDGRVVATGTQQMLRRTLPGK